MSGETDESFETLVHYVRDSRGFDFTGYKRTSLMRRVRYRMEQVGSETFDEYLDLLQANSNEFDALFNAILINVTSFFRDPPAWEFLRTTVIPEMLARLAPDAPIRVWSAGCASGQEAFTLAMLLAEALSPEEFRQRVKIYATDVDEDSLGTARVAAYEARAVESVPEEYLTKYLDHVGSRYVISKDLRRAVIFGRNDLVRDAPISRVDLLTCRNTLMYLNAETQRKVLARLHFALAPAGVLFLGHAEMLLSHTDRFAPMDLKHRIFLKAPGSASDTLRFEAAVARPERLGDLTGLNSVRDLAFRASPVAQLVITGDDTVAMINRQAEVTFGLSGRDIGRLLRDLEVSYRPVELRSFVEQAKVERRSARIQDISWQRAGAETIWFDIHVNPLVDGQNGLVGISIVFFDVTANRTLLDKVVQTNSQLEAAYEELQSTNDELQTINEALRERSGQLDDARRFLDSLVNSVHFGMIVIDREMRVLTWNSGCEQLWGLRSEETTGVALTALDIGLPLTALRPLIGAAFVDQDSVGDTRIDAVNRRGRHITVRVICTAFRVGEGTVDGALLLMEQLGPTEEQRSPVAE